MVQIFTATGQKCSCSSRKRSTLMGGRPSRHGVQSLVFFSFMLHWIPSVFVGALIPPDGTCSLNVLLPFTFSMDLSGQSDPQSTSIFTKSRVYNLGYFHLAAALMAMEHFNARDGRVTPELEQLTTAEGNQCNIQFDIDNNVSFLDTGTVGQLGNTLMYEVAREQAQFQLCAVAGPYFDIPALNAAIMTAASEVPHLPHRGYNIRLSQTFVSPMTTTITADNVLLSQAVTAYLLQTKRDNYVAILHTLLDFGTQVATALGVVFSASGIEQWQAYPYVSPFLRNNDKGEDHERSIPVMLKRLKDRGFRTIVVSLDVFLEDLAAIADAAESLGLLNGDYVWIFMPLFEQPAYHNLIQLPNVLRDGLGLPSFENVTKMLRGAALIHEVDNYQYKGDSDPFLLAWRENDADFVDRVNQAYTNNTIQQGTKDMLLPPSFFQMYPPEAGSAKIYDVIMAIGMGACQAEKEDGSGAITGISHRDGIRVLNFTGATGTVMFGDPLSNGTIIQVRRPETVFFGVYNMYPPSTLTTKPDASKDSSFDEAFVLTETVTGLLGPHSLSAVNGKWKQWGPIFVYANGGIDPPKLLRDVPEQNYLSNGMRIVGLTLMSISLLCCAVSLAFVVLRWSNRIIRASQPYFLCLLLIGAAVTSTAILTVSNDESYGWDENALSIACMAAPWLCCVGHSITYGALFCKLWRVNQVLQFTRRKISAKAVAGPLVALLFATIAILTAWTVHDPLTWVRVEFDRQTGESIGQCDSDSMIIYVSTLGVAMAIPTLLTCVMAWKTKDVDETFSESNWIFTLIIIQIQVILVSIPIVVILRDISTDGRYMGLVILIWSFPMSTVWLIMGPKVVAYFRDIELSAASSRVSRVRGASSHGGVRISGLSGASSRGRDQNSELESAFNSNRSERNSGAT